MQIVGRRVRALIQAGPRARRLVLDGPDGFEGREAARNGSRDQGQAPIVRLRRRLRRPLLRRRAESGEGPARGRGRMGEGGVKWAGAMWESGQQPATFLPHYQPALRRGLGMSRTFTSAVASLVLVVSFAGSVAAGPFEDAAAAYERGDFWTALRLLRPLAVHGNADAQAKLGNIWYFGMGVPKDTKLAAGWYRKAAEHGNADAQAMLRRLYNESEGVMPACRQEPEDSQNLQYQYRSLVSKLIGSGMSHSDVMYLAEHWSTVMLETSPMDVDNRQKLREHYSRLEGKLIRNGVPITDAVNMAFQDYRFAKATTPPCAR
jgi:Sel1 repeat